MSNSALWRKLRQNYPAPVKGGDVRGGYCVGGAYCKEVGQGSGFPSASTLAKAFRNRLGLPEPAAKYYADHVIRENDKGNFNQAWDWLAAALKV